jgi:hypothetical protein
MKKIKEINVEKDRILVLIDSGGYFQDRDDNVAILENLNFKVISINGNGNLIKVEKENGNRLSQTLKELEQSGFY